MCGYNNSTVYIDSSFLLNVVLPLTLGSTLRGGTYPEIFLFSDTIGIYTIQLRIPAVKEKVTCVVH